MMESWPPPENDAATVDTVTESSVETVDSPTALNNNNREKEDGKQTEKTVSNDDEESAKDVPPKSEDEVLEEKPNKEESQKDDNDMINIEQKDAQTESTPKQLPPTPKRANNNNANSEDYSYVLADDPQTREPVHASIVEILQVIRAVLGHAAKTPRAVEYALDIINLLVTYRYVSGRAGGQDDTSGSGSAAINKAKDDENVEGEEKEPSLLHSVLESITSSSEMTVDAVQIALIKCLMSVMTSPKCAVHEGSMLLCLRAIFHVYLVARSQTAKDMSKAALLDMMRSVFSRMEAYDVITKSMNKNTAPVLTPTNSKEKEDEDNYMPPPFPSQFHTDSYVLFRALCRMSSKELPVDDDEVAAATTSATTKVATSPTAAGKDPLALNNKVLSLDLILSSMDYLGDAFRESRFLHLVQHYLCVSLLQNCMSHQAEVAYLSQKIFLVLVRLYLCSRRFRIY